MYKPGAYATWLSLFQKLGVGTGAVLENALTCFKGKIQPVKAWVALFQFVHHAQTLKVVLKAVALYVRALWQRFQTRIQCVLTCVTKWGVPQIMGQGYSLDEVFIQLQGTRNTPAQLRDFERVCQTGTKKVAFMVQKDLGFVDQTSERRGMNDAVPVTLKR